MKNTNGSKRLELGLW